MITKHLEAIISLIMTPVQQLAIGEHRPPHVAYVFTSATAQEQFIINAFQTSCERTGILFSIYDLTNEHDKIKEVLTWLSADALTDAIVVTQSLQKIGQAIIPQEKNVAISSAHYLSLRAQVISLILAAEITPAKEKRVICISEAPDVCEAVRTFSQTAQAAFSQQPSSVDAQNLLQADVIVTAQDKHNSLPLASLPDVVHVVDLGQTITDEHMIGDLEAAPDTREGVIRLGEPEDIMAIEIALMLARVVHSYQRV